MRRVLLLFSQYLLLTSMILLMTCSIQSTYSLPASVLDGIPEDDDDEDLKVAPKPDGIYVNDESKQFLKDNKMKKGVITLPSGLQFKMVEQGLGQYRVLTDKQEVKVKYLASKVNYEPFSIWGDEKDSMTMVVGDVIWGWKEAWKLMVEGDKWELYIPPHLSKEMLGTDYTGEVVVCDMELIEIIGPKLPFSKKEVDYANKISTWNISKLNSEIDRIDKLVKDDKNIKAGNVLDWFIKRLTLLQQQKVRLQDKEDEDDDDDDDEDDDKSSDEL